MKLNECYGEDRDLFHEVYAELFSQVVGPLPSRCLTDESEQMCILCLVVDAHAGHADRLDNSKE